MNHITLTMSASFIVDSLYTNHLKALLLCMLFCNSYVDPNRFLLANFASYAHTLSRRPPHTRDITEPATAEAVRPSKRLNALA